MRIVDIVVRPIAVDLPLAFSGGTYNLARRASILCRITTDAGHTGYVCVGNEAKYTDHFFSLLRGPFKQILVGSDPMATSAIWERMVKHATGYVDRASVMMAMATVDTTLWDLKGKICGQPLYKLLGGHSDRVPMIGIGGYYETSTDAAGIRREIAEYKRQGLAGIKFKVGALAIEADAERVRVARQAAGDDFAIVVDSNMAWTPDVAVRFANSIRDMNPAWLEEPVHWRNVVRGLREVRTKTGIPVGAGQTEESVYGCWALLAGESVDVINVTSNRGGGPTAWMRIAAAASLVDVRMGQVAEPHVSMHLMAAIPNATFVECYPDARRDPFWDKLYLDRPAVENGCIRLPDKPGIGLTIDEAAAERWAVGLWA
ncbi:MAG: mandelate racemase/muconate lactonizing enzyme family protein [Alphaproteobacteria bacterium]|nr:mandelate racemase/muconate lactonizing enzyme family protein [Alphaproteobacteria bacterium]